MRGGNAWEGAKKSHPQAFLFYKMATTVVYSGYALPAGTGSNASIVFPTQIGLPSIVFKWANHCTSSGIVGDSAWAFSVYKDDSSIMSGTQGFRDADNVSTTACAKLSAINWFLELVNTGATGVDLQDKWISFDSNGFTYNQNTNNITGALYHYLAIAGTDKQNIKLGQLTANTVVGLQSVAGIGFRPDLLILYCSERTTNGSSTTLFHSFGAGDSAGNQWVISAEAVNGATMTSTSIINRAQRTDNIIQNLTTAPGTDSLASLVSLDASGFTINWSTAPASAWLVNYIAIKGPGLRVGNFTKTTAAAPATQLVPVGVQPKGVILVSYESVAGTSLLGDLREAWGFTDGVRQGCISCHSVTASINTVAKSLNNFDRILKFLTAPATIDAQATASFSNGQLKLVWDINNATPAQILFIAFGDNHQGSEQVIKQAVVRKAYK